MYLFVLLWGGTALCAECRKAMAGWKGSRLQPWEPLDFFVVVVLKVWLFFLSLPFLLYISLEKMSQSLAQANLEFRM